MASQLNVFSAGVAMGVVSDLVPKWNESRPDFPIKVTPGGSVIGVKQYLAGEPYDLLILADDHLIAQALVPNEATGYAVFAGNKMVIAANEGRTIDSSDWEAKLTAPGAIYAHFDPHADPGGYRAVLAMTLADNHRPGLSAKLLDGPGRLTLNKPGPGEPKPNFDYFFAYYSMAKAKGLTFAELPAVMDLSLDSLADAYAKAEFKIDETITVKGAPIAHALVIPKKAPNPKVALEFAQVFLASDFASYGFLPRKSLSGSLLGSEL
ncbi:MAG: substrate-binding domain-containing protein [Deltaproteobacteria bacterium]|jgi:molybdate/tungstate transport system substrate-binding protein|nr:substrate-binding domain-containing protein [Deltaproteobacteria bacterium]